MSGGVDMGGKSKACPKCANFYDILGTNLGTGEVTCPRCKGEGRVYVVFLNDV